MEHVITDVFRSVHGHIGGDDLCVDLSGLCTLSMHLWNVRYRVLCCCLYTVHHGPAWTSFLPRYLVTETALVLCLLSCRFESVWTVSLGMESHSCIARICVTINKNLLAFEITTNPPLIIAGGRDCTAFLHAHVRKSHNV